CAPAGSLSVCWIGDKLIVRRLLRRGSERRNSGDKSKTPMATKIITATWITALACLSASCASSKASTNGPGGNTGGTMGGMGSDNGGSDVDVGSAGKTASAGGVGLPTEIPPVAPPGSCGLEKPAFCETFDTPRPGGKGGDIDEKLWAFSRWGHETRQHFVRIPASTETDRTIDSVFCGKPFSGLLPPNDVVSCDGVGADGLTSKQLNEVFDDQGDFAFNSMRIRQLFDFTGRTGTITFDVDAKVNPYNLGHGWWVELWITEDPSPMPYHEAPGIVPFPRTGVGVNFQGLNSCPQGREATEVSRVFVTKDYKILHDYPGWELQHDTDAGRCITTADQKLNRFKVTVTKDRMEIWGSDHTDGTNLHRLAVAPILDLPFSKGYVHLQHSQYNARKDGNVTGVQTYRWDNIGFDGPAYAVPRVYEVPENVLPDIDEAGGHMYGYQLSPEFVSVPLSGVDLSGATSASLNLNLLADSGRKLLYRF